DIYLPSSKGGMVPLSAFSRYEPTQTALAVNHQSQFPAVTLTFNLAPGVALGDAVSAIQAAVRPLGLPAGIQGSVQGTAQIFQARVLRFRPIMMTTMAALLGALPLALGRGIGSELRRPLGIAIVGGLIVSQALTLYTTPVVYLYLDRVRLWWARGRAGHGRPLAPATADAPQP